MPTRSIPTYDNFELLIDRGPRDYRARVIHSPAGEAAVEFAMPFTDDELAGFLWQSFGRNRQVRVVPKREGNAPALDALTFGRRLYEAAFGGDVGGRLGDSLRVVQAKNQGLRVRLRLDRGVPELSDLPWECLFSPALHRFLALSDETPVVRYPEVGEAVTPLPVPPPLSILAVVTNPSDLPSLAGREEWERMQKALADLKARRLIRLDPLQPPTYEGLQSHLLRSEVHVLHFIGHGLFDRAGNTGALIFEDPECLADRISADVLATLLADHPALRLVVLNACEGARSGSADFFAGVAQLLTRQGLPAVLAMQFPVSDRAAVVLSQEFYGALADGYPVDTAVSEARKAMNARGNPLEWATPVLFSRAEDNRLIALPAGAHLPVVDRKPFEPETVLVPGGAFLMGSEDSASLPWERPEHVVDLPAFRIGKYPVTVRQYAAFVKDNKDRGAPPGWFNREPPPETLDHPVTGVSWFDAVTYARWLSDHTARCYGLPSEAEWEKAASWEAGVASDANRERPRQRKRRYPWGDAWAEGRGNTAGSGTTPVTAYPAGASAYGVVDLLGNVQEWTRSLWGDQPAQAKYAYPYAPDDGREVTSPEQLPGQARLVHRGGSYRSQPLELRCTARGNSIAGSRIAWRGFRVMMMLQEE